MSAVRTKVLVGTASWQEQGFIDDWYPKGLAKSRLLPWYAEHFSFVEVNSTFYGIPRAEVADQWRRQTPDDFVFDIKLHRLLSRHATELKFLPPELRKFAMTTASGKKIEVTPRIEKFVAERFLAGMRPLIDSQKLGAFLLQLPPSFRPDVHSLEELDHVLGLFAEFPVAVELRNRFWLEEQRRERTISFFKSRQVACVSVDAPESEHFSIMPNVDFITTSRLAYFRAHGRNAEGYIKGRTVQERFDHNYSDEELRQIAGRVAQAAGETKAVHVVFNNNRSSYAPTSALRFRELLTKAHPELDVVHPHPAQAALL